MTDKLFDTIRRIKCFFGFHPQWEEAGSEIIREEQRTFHTGMKYTVRCGVCGGEWELKTGGRMWGG